MSIRERLLAGELKPGSHMFPRVIDQARSVTNRDGTISSYPRVHAITLGVDSWISAEGEFVSLDEAETKLKQEMGEAEVGRANELMQIRIRRGVLISKREHDEIVLEKNQAIDRLNSWSRRWDRLWVKPWFKGACGLTGALGAFVCLAPVLWVLREWFLWWFPVP